MHWFAHYLNQSSERTVNDSQSVLVLITRQAVTMGPRKAAGQCLHVGGLHWPVPVWFHYLGFQPPRKAKDQNEQMKKLSCLLHQKWGLFISSYMAVGATSEWKQIAPLKQEYVYRLFLESELSCIGFPPGKLHNPDKTVLILKSHHNM